MSINLITQYSVWFIPLVVLLAAFGSYFYYKKSSSGELTNARRYILALLRFFTILLLGILLLKPVFKLTRNQKQKPLIVVALDNSASILNSSNNLEKTKEELKKTITGLVNKLESEFDVATYSFSGNIKDSLSLSFTGQETNFQSVFDLLDDKYYNTNLGSLVLISDGLVNKGGNPEYLAKKVSFPIYTLAIGDTSVVKDAQVESVEHNPETYLNNNFPFNVNIKAAKLKGKKGKLIISTNKQIVAEQTVLIDNNDFFKKLQFELKATKEGLQSYKAKLIINGADEKNVSNNEQETAIEVKKEKEKILLLYRGYHPDISVFNSAINNSNTYKLDIININKFNDKFNNYEAVIAYQLPSENNIFTKHFNAINELKIPLWIVLGQSSNYQALQSIFPEFEQGNKKMFYDVKPFFNSNFTLFDAKVSPNYFDNFAPLNIPYNKNQINVPVSYQLIGQKIDNHETELPLWYFSEQNNVRKAFLIGEGIWRWRVNEYQIYESHKKIDELVLKTISYLTVKKGRKPLQVDIPKILNSASPVIITAKVYNKTNDLITNQTIDIEIVDSVGKTYPFVFEKYGDSYRLNAGVLPKGLYSYTAKTELGEKKLVEKGKFTINDNAIEKNQLQANHELLYKISDYTKGDMFNISKAEDIAKKIIENNNIKPLYLKVKNYMDLLDKKLLFFIILILLAAEWFFRKFWGVV